jgi:RNA polymerase-binding transcription factor DksA
MNQQEHDKFSKLLAEEEIRIRRELEEVAVKDPAIPDGFQPKQADYGGETRDDELAREMTDSETNSAIEHELKPLLDGIHKAQEKLKNGTYGVCEKCGAEIPAERLETLPMTPYCVNCAA